MAEKRSLKGAHVDMLDAIAKKLGVDPSEAFGRIVSAAHSKLIEGEGQAGAPALSTTSRANEPPAARKSRHDATNQAAGAEDRSPEARAKADEALEQVGEPHDGHELEDSSNEHQDAPERGDRANPLAMIKRWANTAAPDDDEDDEEDDEPKKPAPVAKVMLGGERSRELQRQRRVATHGRSQR